MYCSLILALLLLTHTHLLDGLHGWWRILVAAQIHHDPGDIAEEGDRDGGTDEREQGLNHAQADHIVSALRAITWRKNTHTHTDPKHVDSVQYSFYHLTHSGSHQQWLTYDVAQGPDCLFTHILVRRVKQLQEEWHSICTKETDWHISLKNIQKPLSHIVLVTLL